VDDFSQYVAKSFLLTQTSSGNVETTQLRFGSPLRDPFVDPSPHLFGFRPLVCESPG